VAIAPNEQIWRVNFQELNRRVYNSIAADIMRTSYKGEKYGQFVEAMLYMTKNPNPVDSDHASVVPRMSVSNALKIADIRKASKQIHDDPLSAADIESVIETLQKDQENSKHCQELDTDDNDDLPYPASDGLSKRRKAERTSDREGGSIIIATPSRRRKKLPSLSSCLWGDNGNKTYQFDTPTALNIARTATLLQIIEQRFGPNARRIWNMLYLEGQMEQKAITQDSMLGNTRPREILYAMLRNGFVSLQDIPRNADRAPSRTFFTWRATMPSATITAATMLYKSAKNILCRVQHTMTSKEYQDIRKKVSMGIDLTQGEVAKFELFHFQRETLIDSLLALDKELALFQFDKEDKAVGRDNREVTMIDDDRGSQPRPRR